MGQRTPEGRRSLSFLRPALGRLRRAPVAAMCPLWLGLLWAVGGAVPPLLAQALGQPQAPLVACPSACGPADSGLAADPGREAADELDAPSAAQRGPA